MLETNRDYIFRFLDKLNIQTVRQLPSEWAEQNRIITSGSNHKGKFSYNLTPYMKEIVNRLSPDDPCRQITLMGGSQLGKSHGLIFNAIGYFIKNKPTNIFLTAGDDDLVKDTVNKIDEMIQNSGLKHLIRANVQKKSNQKSGDTDREKQFVGGGTLIVQSIKAPDKIKQNSFEIIILDDIESAVRTNTKNVGDIVNLALTRATSYGDTYKLVLVGVPETKNNSIIEPAYLDGDQRKYLLPCPCCGEYIEIKWYEKIEGEKKEHAGVIFETDNLGKLIEKSVGYICQSCKSFFKETKKQEMLMNGIWTPTAVPKTPYNLSYHLPALLAPHKFFGWAHYAQEWLDIFPSHGIVLESKLHHFKNHVLAETYEVRKKEVNSSLISKNLRDYNIGNIPSKLSVTDGNGSIILLTCAVDLNGFEDDSRLDYEVVAHCASGSTYSIIHGSIGTFQRGLSKENRECWNYQHGIERNVWTEFRKVLSTEFKTEDDTIMKIAICGIDTGHFTQLAYHFVEVGFTGCILVAMKGDSEEKKRAISADTPCFRKSHERYDLYLIQSNQIKDTLSELMKLRYQKGYSQPSGFMNFPTPSDEKYDYRFFDQYEGEHRVPISNANGIEVAYIWEKKNSSSINHWWDCRVYNLALRDIYAHNFIKAYNQNSKIKIEFTWANFTKLIIELLE